MGERKKGHKVAVEAVVPGGILKDHTEDVVGDGS